MKGIPLAYDRDLQEDKAPVFAARRDLTATVDALAVLVRELVFDAERLANAAADPHLLASDAVERLVEDGVPFRDAHEHVASEVLDGSFASPDALTPPLSPGPGAVRDAIAAARERLRL